MRLAEALSERSDAQARIEQLGRRLYMNAKVQEGEKPAENPQKLLAELSETTSRLRELISRINLTNAAVRVEGETLTELLARRECEALLVSKLREFLDRASETVTRGTKSEVVVRSTVDVEALRREVDERSRALRELDMKIQAANWTAELL